MRSMNVIEQEQETRDVWFRNNLERARSCFVEMTRPEFTAALSQVATELARRLERGGTVYWCGNGGSSSDAQHLAAELVGRFGKPGRGWPSVALSADSSVLTSAANDFGYVTVFQRQVSALVGADDVVVGISTSGTSENVIAAFVEAQQKGAMTVALTGPRDSSLADVAELTIRAPGQSTSDIQTCLIAIGQLLCEAAIELAESWEERDA